MLGWVNFHVVNQPYLSKPCSNTKHNWSLDFFHCFQTFLIYNLLTRNIRMLLILLALKII